MLVIDHAGTGRGGGPLTTSSESIGLLRAQGLCRIIVAVDTIDRTFDAEHLFGDAASPADLSVRLSDLAHPALWRRERGETGYPAYWPEIDGWSRRRRMQMDQLLAADGQKLATVLTWDRHAFKDLTTRQQASLAPSHGALERVGWANAWKDGGADLTAAERRAIGDLAYRGRPGPRWHAVHARAALASAWLDRWIRLEVLPVGRPAMPVSQLAVEWPQTVLSRTDDFDRWMECAAAGAAPTSDPVDRSPYAG